MLHLRCAGLSMVIPITYLQESDVCLADLCDVLHCDHLATENLWDGKSAFDPYARHAPCIPAKEAELKARCRVSCS